MNDPNEKVIDKLRKLIAHEESARSIGSLQEAEAFAAKIQALLTEHKLDMARVVQTDLGDDKIEGEIAQEYFHPKDAGLPGGNTRNFWMERLAQSVAVGHFCRLLVMKRTTTLIFIGRPADRAAAIYVFTTLARTAMRLADIEAKKQPKAPSYMKPADAAVRTIGFKRSFYAGFCQAIGDRLVAARAAAENTKTPTGQSTALVLRRADTAVAQWMAQKLHVGRSSSIGSNMHGSHDGYASGHKAGSNASITAGALNSSGKAARQIGGKS